MGLSVGVDVGGTKIAAGVVDEQGVVLEKVRAPSPALDPERMRDTLLQVVRELSSRHAVCAVGIGAAGQVSEDRRHLYFAPHLPQWSGAVGAHVEDALGLPVVVENDGNAAAWAEFRFGAGRGVADQVLVAVGTGIGGGLILDGRLYRGGHGLAAEIGHLNHVPDGRPCECGRLGCWEQYASGSALQFDARHAAEHGRAPALLEAAGGDPRAVTGAMVTELAHAGEPEACALFERLGRHLGAGIAALVSLLDPSLVVLGGGVSDAGELLLRPTAAALDEEVTGHGRRPVPELRLAALGNDAGLVGVADLARVAT